MQQVMFSTYSTF